jgi:hypothetical protein
VLIVAVLPAGAALAGEEPEQLWLFGPFGRLAGSASVDDPAGDHHGDPLDAFARGVPLHLDTGPRGPAIDHVEIVATAIDGSRALVVLAEGTAEEDDTREVAFSGPSESGDWILEARVVDSAARTSLGAWSLHVPDRDLPADGLVDVTAPDVRLASATHAVDGWPGRGCYVYFCVEVGRPPPLAQLEVLEVDEGETLALSLSDGSPIPGWRGTWTTLDGSLPRPARAAAEDPADPPEAPGSEVHLAAPGIGEWLLDAEVVFDRERGWLRSLFRVAVT